MSDQSRARQLNTDIRREVEHMNLADVEALFAVTLKRDPDGKIVPWMCLVADVSDEQRQELRGQMQAFFDTLRKAYAPTEAKA